MSEKAEFAAKIEGFWHTLQQDTASRAALRRCHDVTETQFVPVIYELARSIRTQKNYRNLERIGAVAGLCAWVRDIDNSAASGQQMSRTIAGDTRLVSEMRFRRLIQCQTVTDLYIPLVRILRLMKGQINLADLAQSVLFWGDATRKIWAYEYYGAATVPERQANPEDEVLASA
ncbi:MAG: type I-E CRISPR-associated protein Cse2/CasB [Spirochaetales bacterium]|nr:type I-E CRISPR-associated protein Cse2/CasB [Spirochaetales bacterium]